MQVYLDTLENVHVDDEVLLDCRVLHRDWNPLPGTGPAPEGTVWQVMKEDLPKSLVQDWCHGVGGTREEAMESFKDVYRRIKKASEYYSPDFPTVWDTEPNLD